MPFVKVAHKHTRIIFIIFDLACHWISQTDCWSVVKLNFFIGLLLLDGGPAHFVVFTYEHCTVIVQCCATIQSTEGLHHCPLHGMILTSHIESTSFRAKSYIHVLNVGYII